MKKAYLVFFVLLVVCIHVQQSRRLIRDPFLSGVVVEPPLPAVTPGTLIDGSFLAAAEKGLRSAFALKGYCVRLNGQLNYSVFDEMSRGEIILGFDDHLFEKSYIDYINGLNDISDEGLERMAKDLKELQDLLKKRNRHLVFLITPSKSVVMRNFIPGKFLSPRASHFVPPYDRMVRKLENNGVTFVDGRRIVSDLKDQSRYPVFPASGTHWSMFAASHVMIGIFTVVERVMQRPVAQLHLEGVRMASPPRYADDDLLDLSNLLYPRGLWRPNPYPTTVSVYQPHQYLPSYLIVGGSFVHSVNAFLLNNPCYKKLVFYYYNSKRFTFPVFTPGKIVKKRMVWNQSADAGIFFQDFRGTLLPQILGYKNEASTNTMLKPYGGIWRIPAGRKFLSDVFYDKIYPDDSLCRFSQIDIEPIDKKALDWEREVFSNDVIIIEANETNFQNMGGGFIEEALAKLRVEAR